MEGFVQEAVMNDDTVAPHPRSGNGAAFAGLVDRNRHAVYGIALNMCTSPEAAAEVTRQAFLAAWRESCLSLAPRDARIWVLGIAMRMALAERTRARTLPRVSPSISVAGALRQALDAMDDGVRGALVLRDVLDLPSREGAAILGIPEEDFRSRVHRARLALGRFIDRFAAA
jgi:DNA-directed RNA polymerase specialized sigma24 family protein